MRSGFLTQGMKLMTDKWHRRFLDLAEFYSTWSKDPSTKCGAVIVRPDKTVASVGYNGFPVGIADTEERLTNRDLKYSLVIHCEMNAVLNAHGSVKGCTLYTFPFLTCDRCSVHMIAAGIKQVVAPKCPADKVERWASALNKAHANYTEAGVGVHLLQREPKDYLNMPSSLQGDGRHPPSS